MSKTIKFEKVPRRDSAAMQLAYGGFKSGNHGDLRKEKSANECRKFKFNNDPSED